MKDKNAQGGREESKYYVVVNAHDCDVQKGKWKVRGDVMTLIRFFNVSV